MKELKKQLQSGVFHNVYLFYGEEKYLLEMYLDKLTKQLLANGDATMNYDFFDKNSMNVDKFFFACETLPFFSDRRVIVVRDVKLFKAKNKDMDEVAKRIMDIPDSTTVIFVEDEVDKRNKLYKLVNKQGCVASFELLTENDLIKWIGQKLHSAGKKIERSTALHFVKTVGTDMATIQQELDKLIMYNLDEEVVTRESVDTVCTRTIENKIFELVGAMGQNRRERALLLYRDMLTAKEPPGRILFMLIRQFRLILQAKLLSSKGMGERDIASKIKVAPFVVRECLRQGKGIDLTNLKNALGDCLETDSHIKTGRLDAHIGVEMIIMKYS